VTFYSLINTKLEEEISDFKFRLSNNLHGVIS